MNQIYKVIYSKVKHQYIVVSELAHRNTKNAGKIVGKNAATLLTVLALTAGIGIIPIEAATNSIWTGNTDKDGNYTAYLDEENTIEKGENNYIIGDGNALRRLSNSFILGNNNDLYTSYNSSTGTNGEYTIVIGNNNTTKSNFGNGILLGNNTQVTEGLARDTLLFGNDIEWKSGNNSVVVGNASGGSGNDVVVIGSNSTAGGTGDIVIGAGTSADASGTANTIAIGHNTTVSSTETTYVGSWGNIASGHSAALGDRISIGTSSLGSIAIGGSAAIGNQSYYSIAIGGSGGGDTEGNTSVKDGAYAGIALGRKAEVGENSNYSTAIGFESIIGSNDWATLAQGYKSSVGNSAQYSMAIGSNASIGESVKWSTAIGSNAEISSGVEQSTALGGYGATVTANRGTALGTYATVNAEGGMAVGYNSSVEEGAENSTSIGNGSTVTKEDILTDDDVNAFIASLDTSVLGSAYNDIYNIQNGDAYGVISVGTADSPRRIINVAKGRIGPDSTDAVNGSQLYGAVAYLDGRIDSLADTMSGGEIWSKDDNLSVQHPHEIEEDSANTGIVSGSGTDNAGSGDSTSTETGTGESSTAGAGDNTHYLDLAEDFVLGKPDETGNMDSGSLTINDASRNNPITINENDENGIGDGVIKGLSNTEWDWNKYDNGEYATSSIGATEAQLHGAMEGTVQYDRDDQGNIDKTNITLNKGGDSVAIHNVAAGTADTDAVNVGQLNEAWDQINNNTTAITNIGNKVGELDSRIDEVGAGAAALAALHPLDFDPDDKWDFAAGYGNYRGENAVAIGAFYRPNEDTMFSVGGTVGNDDNMVNAGVSFKIGQGNGVSTSRVAMAKEIKDLRRELEAMKSAMLDVNAGRRLDTSKLQLFPDVPQNHWAYEYVATLAGNGVIEGYPDGNFDGARPMTRYEFAAMLYRAMLNGAKLSDKILTEFAPELERFTVDVVHTDSDGNPTVERVRVVKKEQTAE